MSGLLSPPDRDEWKQLLHWLLRVMDADDPDLAFTASVFSHCLKFGGLSDKQAKWAGKIMYRVLASHERGELGHQMHRSVVTTTSCNLSNLTPEGEA